MKIFLWIKDFCGDIKEYLLQFLPLQEIQIHHSLKNKKATVIMISKFGFRGRDWVLEGEEYSPEKVYGLHANILEEYPDTDTEVVFINCDSVGCE